MVILKDDVHGKILAGLFSHRFAIIGRRIPRVFFKNGIKAGLGIETGVKRQRQNLDLCFGWVLQLLFDLFHPVLIDKVKKRLLYLGVQHLRQVVRRNRQHGRQSGQR